LCEIIVRYEFQPEFDKRIEQETFKYLKRKYSENFYKTVKRQKVDSKVIILTGRIGVGKTTFGEKFAKYLEDKELKKEVEKINRLTGYDYMIFDRTYIDTKAFTYHNIKKQDVLDYLQERRLEIDFKNIHK
ncbi:8667_t:CDS:2, partial [Scutellospora calospora]